MKPAARFGIGVVGLPPLRQARLWHGWNGRDMWIALQEPDPHAKMSLPYVYMRTAQGGTVPWLCSQSDLLADDWDIAR
jgi:Protein of unknown function (DUF2829)